MIPDWIGQVGGVVALVIGLGAVAQYLRGSRDKGTITTLEQNNSALTERVALLEAGEKILKAEATAAAVKHAAEVKALEVRISALEAENETLKTQRPSAEAIAEVVAMQQVLHEQIHAHDSEVRPFMDRVNAFMKLAGDPQDNPGAGP